MLPDLMVKISQSFTFSDAFIVSLLFSAFQRPPASSWRNSEAHEGESGLFKAQDNSESLVLKQKKGRNVIKYSDSTQKSLQNRKCHLLRLMDFGLSIVNKNHFCTFQLKSFVLKSIPPGLWLSVAEELGREANMFAFFWLRVQDLC